MLFNTSRCDPLTDVPVVTNCKILVARLSGNLPNGYFMQLAKHYHCFFQFVCNQGSHSVVKTTNLSLQWYIISATDDLTISAIKPLYSLLRGHFKVSLLHVKSSIDDHFLNDVNITQEVVRVISISPRKYYSEWLNQLGTWLYNKSNQGESN